MYAEKIFSIKLLTNITSGLFPFQENSAFATFINVNRRGLTVRSIPNGYEDMILINYHSIIDRIYDIGDFIDSIHTDAPVVPRSKYSFSVSPPQTPPHINVSNRLHKLDYIADEFFYDLRDAIEYLKGRSRDKKLSPCNFYTRAVKIPVATNLPKTTISIPIYMDKSSNIILSSGNRSVSFRINGLPLNACAFYCAYYDSIKDYFTLLKHILRPKLSEWRYRILSHSIREFDFTSIPRPKCDWGLFYRVIPTRLNIYVYYEKYDADELLNSILQKRLIVFDKIK